LFTLPVAGVALSAIFFWQRDVLALLYASHFVVGDDAMAFFLAGDLARIASWVILFALLAVHATWWVALGEVLSLPLFALLVHLAGNDLTLEQAGRLWLFTYGVYLAFNVLGLSVVLGSYRKRRICVRWLGAACARPGSDSCSYREDEQQRHGRKDNLYGPVICESGHLRSRPLERLERHDQLAFFDLVAGADEEFEDAPVGRGRNVERDFGGFEDEDGVVARHGVAR
jgi:drug/metabolite transporter superfamily protein YnfA